MIFKYLIICVSTLIFITASDPHFGNDFSWNKIPKENKDDVRELAWMSTDSFKHYLEDEDDHSRP